MPVDILGTSWDHFRSIAQYSFTYTETRRLVRTDSPGRLPRLSHRSWTMQWLVIWDLLSTPIQFCWIILAFRLPVRACVRACVRVCVCVWLQSALPSYLMWKVAAIEIPFIIISSSSKHKSLNCKWRSDSKFKTHNTIWLKTIWRNKKKKKNV